MAVLEHFVQCKNHQKELFGNIYKVEMAKMRFGSRMKNSEFVASVEIYNTFCSILIENKDSL